jgi:hypothetical protein
MKRSSVLLLYVVVSLVMAGCAAVAKVESGQQVVANRLVLDLDGPWNRFTRTSAQGASAIDVPTWTVEGFTVDRLQFFVGIKDGQPIAERPRGAKEQRPLDFHATMKAHEIVGLFEGLYTQDGSTFTLDRIEPVTFIGESGFKYSYTLVRKHDDVKLSGVGYGAVHAGELTVINYSAPRLGFFPKYKDQIEKMALGARMKG